MSEKDLPSSQAGEERGGRESDTGVAREEGYHPVAERLQGRRAASHLFRWEGGETVEISGDFVATPRSLGVPTDIHHSHDCTKRLVY